jgi:uncharacterized protein
MAKKNKKKSNKKLFSINFILILISSVMFSIGGYLLIENKNQIDEDIKQQEEKLHDKSLEEKYQQQQIAKYVEEKTKALDIEYAGNIDNQLYIDEPKSKKIKHTFNYEETFNEKEYEEQEEIVEPKKIIEKEPQQKIVKEQPKSKKKYVVSNKPKLAIIIDDVTTNYQVKKIKQIGYDVNIAFLPPTPRHPNSAKIANNIETYMIHLPLQASSNRYDEKNTLYIKDNISTIDNRIKTLKDLYPNAKFINNHTGSKFTANKNAMDNLFKVLRKYDYTFVDSRTTANSVAKEMAKKNGVRMLSRNIFLDNKKDKKYIQNQLKKAIKIAKKHGSAIAIGHPYNITFNTLKESKHLLNDLQIVYVDRL